MKTKIYADTSFFVGLKVYEDPHHDVAARYFEKWQDEVWLWSPWHRVEVLNSLRQLTLHPDAKKRLLKDEVQSIIRHLEADVRVGYFTHMEQDWRDVLRTANELSVAHGFTLPCRAADILHVGYALELATDLFVSFDGDQLALARAAGLETLVPA